jgi:hypothetical protein
MYPSTVFAEIGKDHLTLGKPSRGCSLMEARAKELRAAGGNHHPIELI